MALFVGRYDIKFMSILGLLKTCRKQCALPAACLSGALVWMAAHHFQKIQETNRQRPATAFLKLAQEQPHSKEAAPEPLAERTPKEIAETLRTDPRGTQEEDRSRVWLFLKEAEGWKTENETEWLLGADEALSWLRGATQAAAEIEKDLCSLVLAQNLPSSLREYALQHLGLWAEEHASGVGVLETLKQAFLSEKTSALAGIALAGLYRSRFSTQEAAWIQTSSLALASSTTANPRARTAALQILAQSGVREAEPIARALLSKGATIDEKISALGVLGSIGNAETLGWLTSFAKDPEPLTATAHQQALRLLRSRWNRGN